MTLEGMTILLGVHAKVSIFPLRAFVGRCHHPSVSMSFLQRQQY